MESENTQSIEEVIDNRIHENGWIVVEKAGPDRPGGYEIVLNTKEIINAVIAEHYRRLPPGDEGLATALANGLNALSKYWVPFEFWSESSKTHYIQAMGAVTAAMRQRGWLEPEEVSRLRDEHDKLAKNFGVNAKLLEAKIAAMEAKPKQYNSVQDMVDATSPELSQEFRDRKPNGERIRELTEDNADRLTEAEIRAAIDAKQEDFLMRLQRWEKTKATVVGAVMEEEPCSCCNAEPSSIKVEMLPREITWREVEEAILQANQDKRGVRIVFFVVGGTVRWIVEYVDGEALWNGIGADEALTYLRELAEPKPEPITPEKLWAECGGTGPIPEWARYAAVAECERRNAKGGE